MELLWQNGPDVIVHNQTHHKPTNNTATSSNLNQSTSTMTENLNNLIQDDDLTVSWMHSPINESFEREFFANLLLETPTTSNPIEANNIDGLDFLKFGALDDDHFFPRFETFDLAQRNHNLEGTNMTSSNLQSPPDERKNKNHAEQLSPESMSTLEQAVVTSSGRLDSNDTNRRKRKMTDVEESECQSDATQLESAAGNKLCVKSGMTRRGRVPEVHNRSERRRRDRINEKIRVLQELVPHSNKSGTASVLDEVIRYMKSLQMQIQMMCMARIMLPRMQHYTSPLGTAIGPPMLMPFQNYLMPNQATIGEHTVLNQVNYQNLMQNRPGFCEQYASYMGFTSMQNNSQNYHMFARPADGNGYIG